jgi:hypothetical protein
MVSARRLSLKALDFFGTGLLTTFGLPMKMVAKRQYKLPLMGAMSDRLGIYVRDAHFYGPMYRESDLPAKTDVERDLPAVDLNEDGQLALLAELNYGDELAQIPRRQPSQTEYGFDMKQYGIGDAEIAYSMIRHFKPRRIIEVGSGASTLIAHEALTSNRAEDESYVCEQICIEPYLQPWLEQTGVTTIRRRVELLELDLFTSLGENDILFIDSSHVIRPWGDVLFLYQQVIPRLAPGVLVHVHDVFTPRDYPEKWLRQERRLWNEQYLLEAYLAFNPKAEVLCAANWLKHNHFEAFARACPLMRERPDREPGAFWFRTL